MKVNGSKAGRAKAGLAKTVRSQAGESNTGKPKTATRSSRRARGTDWNRLRRASAASIRKGIANDPDAHATDDQFWKRAKVLMPTPKEIVTMRLDADLLRWFRQERGYQTRINAILRAYMQAHGPA
jgi:uncharacterized protein (DUF4415 family)